MSSKLRYTIFYRDTVKKGKLIKDGQCVAEINFPPDPFTGKERKPKRITSTAGKIKGKEIVKRRLDDFLEAYKEVDVNNADTLTVKGWLKTYVKIYGKKWEDTTREGYQQKIDDLINPYIGDMILSQLLPMNIENLYNILRTVDRSKNPDGTDNPRGKNPDGTAKIGYEEKTILQVHRILHRAFRKAVGDRKLGKNPCDGVDAPTPVEYQPTIYTEELFNELMEKLRGHKMEAIILIAGMCGPRRGELLAISQIRDINLDNGKITIRKNRVATRKKGVIEKKPKNNQEREFAIPSIIIPRLRELRGIGKLYLKSDGKDYSPGSVSAAFSRFLKKNGLPHIRLHDLRHFNGTMMLKYGVSEKEIMKRGGWSTTAMVKRYQHVLEDMDRNSAEKLNNVFKKKDNLSAKIGAKA